MLSRRHVLRRTLPSLALAALLAAPLLTLPRALHAQQPDTADGGSRRGFGGQFAGMQRTSGELTAINGNTLTLKTEDGTTMQVVTTENTRLMKGRGNSVKVAELKPGDGITAMGNLDAPNKTLHAALVFVIDAEQVKQMKENLGKTYIAGRVTAIDLDNARMTVERPDHVAQTIGFDETTSFRRGRRMGAMMGGGAMGAGAMGGGMAGGAQPTPPPAADAESITLADIKVGDYVGGRGFIKNNLFVPTELTVATPGQGRRRSQPNGAPPPPGSSTPPSQR
jgi:hypothetical protein